MDCPDPVLLDRYLDGTATRDEAERVEAHLETCATCGATAREPGAESLLRELREAFDGGPVHGGSGAGREPAPAATRPPPDLERYRILRPIGEGGMGIVYEAEQRSPRRRVALKVVRPLLAGAKALERFRIEAEVLGRLDHPGIARIHEAGSFDAGAGAQPFFAMELVEGQPLDAFVRSANPGLEARIRLLAAIADAVQHAHQKGVIHRDLKPSNVLVDGAGRPRILDFGVARIVGEGDAGATSAGHLVGTVRYMSPEQVSGDPAAVDARSDVHALGLLLFELVSGRLPYDLDGKAVPEMVRVIAEAAPRRLGDVEPRCRGDLDAVAAKALEKDKERRYPSAAALAEDLRRFLGHEPVAARPPSTVYQLRKFARRNRTLAIALAALLLSLGAGIVATAVQAARADRSAEEAVRSERSMREALEEARVRLGQSEEVLELLGDVFRQANPELRTGAEPSMKEAVALAARRLDTGGIDRSVEGRVRSVTGRVFLAFGDHEAARRQLERALDLLEGADSPDLTEVLGVLALLARKEDDLVEAERFSRRALEVSRRLPERHRIWEFKSLFNLGTLALKRERFDEAAPIVEEAVARFRGLPEPTRELGSALMSLAGLRRRQGREEEAETLVREALDVRRRVCGEDHLEVADALLGLAAIRFSRGDLDASEADAARAAAIRAAHLGERHPDVAAARMRLGMIAAARGRYEEAVAIHRECLEISREAFGPAHTTTLAATTVLASALRRTDPAGAERLLREAWDAVEAGRGAASAQALLVLQGLEDVLSGSGRHEEALPLFARHVELARELHPPKSVGVANAVHRHGWSLGRLGRNEEAEKQLLASLALYEEISGGRHPDLPRILDSLATVYAQMGREDDAASCRERIAELRGAGR